MNESEDKFLLPGQIERHLSALSKLYALDGEREMQTLIVNAQTRIHEGWDYEAVRSCMQWIKKHYSGKRIGLPKVGAGLAGGEWITIATIIEEELSGENLTLIEFQSSK